VNLIHLFLLKKRLKIKAQPDTSADWKKRGGLTGKFLASR
jgi:hypothetical protein